MDRVITGAEMNRVSGVDNEEAENMSNYIRNKGLWEPGKRKEVTKVALL